MCVTHTCKDFIKQSDLEKRDKRHEVIEECMNATLFRQYGLQANVTQIYNCDKYGENAQIDATDWIVAGVIAALLLLVILGTLYDISQIKNINNQGKSIIILANDRKNRLKLNCIL